MHKNELLKISTVIATVTMVIAGSWYAVRQTELQTAPVSSQACAGQVIILDAGHGGST